MDWKTRFFWMIVVLPWTPYVLSVTTSDPRLGWGEAQRVLVSGLSSLWQALSSVSGPLEYQRVLANFFKLADPLASAAAVALAMAAAVFLLSLPTNNHSWVRAPRSRLKPPPQGCLVRCGQPARCPPAAPSPRPPG
jgi:hypothetical protein